MSPQKRWRNAARILAASVIITAIGVGIGLGYALAKTELIPQSWDIGPKAAQLPTQILDRNGKLIAEYYSGTADRAVVSLESLPKYVIYALITREDQNFFHEGAMSLRGTFRAAWNIVTGNYFSGGSTITQQLAGLLYANRTSKTITRKLHELWFAFQLEKRLSKDQILEMYLNNVYFGRNNYGIEAASEYYFGHPAAELTLAESAMLVIQLADPARYYWLKYPNRARIIQHVVLEEMVRKGYATQSAVNQSLAEFWGSYPYARAASTSPFSENNSKAPYFTEYVRQQLESELFGNLDYLRDGLVVHTTLNLDYQRVADRVMGEALARYNGEYAKNNEKLFGPVDKSFGPVVNLLALSFGLPEINQVNQVRKEKAAVNDYLANLNPSVSALAMAFGLPQLFNATSHAHAMKQQALQTTQIEGALISLDDHTGEILSMVGGADWNQSHFNRAVDARVQPGSSIKPLYYSAAISSEKLTAASELYDGPTVFVNPDGTIYKPYDFLGQWQGHVSLRWALQDSINVPSLEVFKTVGFEAAIDRISRLLGLSKYKNDPHYFPHVYPLGLGVISVAPINMARAYAVFPNQGREVDPIAVKYVEDRATGKIVAQPERALFEQQKNEGAKLQIMSPQAAYVMVNLLQSVVTAGTLWQTPFDVGGFDGMPMAGKTGTTQNWSDAWTVGFSPYYTTAVWFGFDQGNASLGLGLTGATAAGPVWAEYMKDVQRGLPRVDFPKPATGLVTMRVDARSGLLPTKWSSETKNEIFIAGTEPRQFDTQAEYEAQRDAAIEQKLATSALFESLSGAPPERASPLSSSVPAGMPPLRSAPALRGAPTLHSGPSAPQPPTNAAHGGQKPAQLFNPLLN